MSEISYAYSKLRSDFGRQCFFCDDGPRLIEDIKSDKKMMEPYIYKNPQSKSTQVKYVISEHDANTYRTETTDHGMFHAEGGWPKDMNPNDEEAVVRYRKKMEREDNYVFCMKDLTVSMEHAILQNNAVNIYETYFETMENTITVESTWSRIKLVYRDPIEIPRPIKHYSWSPEGGTHIAVTHCGSEYQHIPPDQTFECFIWDIENPHKPTNTFLIDQPILGLEYSPREFNCLVGGLMSGQVAFFDPRKGTGAVEVSTKELSHRECCHSVMWITSKSMTEFFSTSADGQVLWWDSRKLETPLDSIVLDLRKVDVPVVSEAFSSSCLEYDMGISAKYMVGTHNGYVVCGNRKGTTQAEKLPWAMKCHYGPIHTMQRNQGFSKIFMTVGDWTARMWSDDCKESSVMWTSYYKPKLTGGEWSGGKYSVYFLTRMDGVLDMWDVLQQQREPTISQRVCHEPLTCLRVREDGQFVVVGNTVGTTFLVQYSENLMDNTKNDKIFLSAMFDRESRREKVLESRNREIKFKYLERMKKKREEAGEKDEEEIKEEAEELAGAAEGEEAIIEEVIDYVKLAENEYMTTINRELEEFAERVLLHKEAMERAREAEAAAAAAAAAAADEIEEEEEEEELDDAEGEGGDEAGAAPPAPAPAPDAGGGGDV